jgi:hypothetical protein
MKLKAQVMDEAALNRALMRIAHEITEKNKGHNSLDSDRAIKHKAQLDTLFETTYPKKQRTNKNRRELFSEKVDKQIYYELDGKLMKLIADFYETAQSGKGSRSAGVQGKKKSHK